MSKEDIPVGNRHVKRWTTSLIIREVQFKTPMSCHLALVRRSSSKGLHIMNAREGVEKKEPALPFGGCEKAQSPWRRVWRFLQKLNAELHMTNSHILGLFLEKTLNFKKYKQPKGHRNTV